MQDDHLDRFPKAYGGLGAYALDPASSRVACAARACTQQDLPRGAAAQPVAAVSQEDADEFASLHEPANGWSMARVGVRVRVKVRVRVRVKLSSGTR